MGRRRSDSGEAQLVLRPLSFCGCGWNSTRFVFNIEKTTTKEINHGCCCGLIEIKGIQDIIYSTTKEELFEWCVEEYFLLYLKWDINNRWMIN